MLALNNKDPMTPRRRDLIFKLADDHPPTLAYIHSLESQLHREHIYQWFIDNKITGKKLIAFFMECNGNPKYVAQCVLKKILKRKVTMAEVLGIKK